MTVRVGYIPYLNMVPFHQDFGPKPLAIGSLRFEFQTLSPRGLGLEAEQGSIDAGAMSLVDSFRLAHHFQPAGPYGIGVHRAANSVVLFSKAPLPSIEGVVAVTDETSTSVQLLRVLLEKRYGLEGIHYGRIASAGLYDGSADALLLIGDEAIRARRGGIRGLPIMTDLGEEWFRWQNVPFVFARWVIRRSLGPEVAAALESRLERSLALATAQEDALAEKEARARGFDSKTVQNYWKVFSYRLTPAHFRSIELFEGLAEIPCLTE